MSEDRLIDWRTVIAIGDRRLLPVTVYGEPMRDHRGRIAVRNMQTNRLSYIPEWRLLKAKRQAGDDQ